MTSWLSRSLLTFWINSLRLTSLDWHGMSSSSKLMPVRLLNEAKFCILRKMLHTMELFQALLQHELGSIINACVPQRFEEGTVISSEGEVHDGFYIVLDGLARASRASENGRAA